NFGAAHGDITGGMVDVRSRTPRDGFHGYVKQSLLDSSVLLEGAPTPEVRIAGAIRRSWVDLILSNVGSSKDFSYTTAPRYYDAQLRLDYKPDASAHSFSLLALISDDQLGLLVKRPLDADPNRSGDIFEELQFSQVRARHSWRSGALTIDSSGFFGTELTDQRRGITLDVKVNGVLLGLRSTASYTFSDALAGSFGLDVNNDHIRYHAKAPASGPDREGDPVSLF